MTTTLITPADPYARSRPVVRVDRARLMVALDCTQVAPAIRWYSFADLWAVEANRRDLEYLLPVHGCLTADEHATGLAAIAASAERAKAKTLVVELTPDMAASVNFSQGVDIRIVPKVSLWHPALKEAG